MGQVTPQGKLAGREAQTFAVRRLILPEKNGVDPCKSSVVVLDVVGQQRESV